MNKVHLDVDLNKLSDNLKKIKSVIDESVKIMAVVKSNAYGHGLISIAKALEGKVDYLGVGLLEEGVALREGGIKAPILILGPTYDFEQAQKHQLVMSICSLDHYHQALAWASKENTVLTFHLKVDTGMHRFGIGIDEVDKFIALYDSRYTYMEGVYSHLATTFKSNEKRVKKQKACFDNFIKQFKDYGFDCIYHLVNSENAIDFKEGHYNMVRIGNALYGPCNSKRQIGLQKIATIKAPLLSVISVKKGEPIGYGASYRAKKAMKIGVIPFGFYEGYGLYKKPVGIHLIAFLLFCLKEIYRFLFRNTSAIAYKGQFLPVVGRINMQYTMIGLPRETDVSIGEEIEINVSPIYIKENIIRTYRGGH